MEVWYWRVLEESNQHMVHTALRCADTRRCALGRLLVYHGVESQTLGRGGAQRAETETEMRHEAPRDGERPDFRFTAVRVLCRAAAPTAAAAAASDSFTLLWSLALILILLLPLPSAVPALNLNARTANSNSDFGFGSSRRRLGAPWPLGT